MSDYYSIPRNSNWNYGGQNFRLSRSKIELFLQCPRCFYLDNKLGIKRPAGFPFTLNSAVDTLLKKEFDFYREKGEPHPIMVKYNIPAVPFKHKDMDLWRDALKGGVEYLHSLTKFRLCGAPDDIWIKEDGELIVVDYKSTSKEEEIKELDKEWQIGYKRQMEMYQYLLRKNGFKVSDTGYFVYANGKTDVPNFNNKLEFETNLVTYTGNDSWIENTIYKIYECLNSKVVPCASDTCDECLYEKVKNTVKKQSF